MSAPRFHHVVLTSFNVIKSRDPRDIRNTIRADPTWLGKRFDIYERYCLPGMLRQSTNDFEWYVYFDPGTPQEFLDRALRGFEGRPNFKIKFTRMYGTEQFQEHFRQDLDPSIGWLLTTRLDNDDGLHLDYIKTLHDEVRVGTEEVLDFPLGILDANGVPYLSRQTCNAFLTLSEPMSKMRSVYSFRHKEARRSYRVRELRIGDNEPAWSQGIYGRTISNKIRGWRAPYSAIPAGLVISREPHVAPDDWKTIAYENATKGVFRYCRDLAISVWHLIKRPPWVTRPD